MIQKQFFFFSVKSTYDELQIWDEIDKKKKKKVENKRKRRKREGIEWASAIKVWQVAGIHYSRVQWWG